MIGIRCSGNDLLIGYNMKIEKLIDKYLREGEEFTQKPLRAIRTKLTKKLNDLKTPFGIKTHLQGRKEGTWDIQFDNNAGASLDADDWKQFITLDLYDEKQPYIEVYASIVGTDKRGRTDSEKLGGKKFKIKTEDDIDRVIKYVKNQAKKHYKFNI